MGLTKDEFMELVHKDIEKREKQKIDQKRKAYDDYRAFKIDQSFRYGSRYTKKKNVRR